MSQTIELKIKPNFVAELAKGYPLILKDAAEQLDDTLVEGTLLKIVRPNGKYIATGYYGKQNKGIGWVLTQNPQQEIDQDFFEDKTKICFEIKRIFF